MKMTSRERTLLTILLAFLIIGGYYYFFADSKEAKIEELNIIVDQKQQELNEALKIDEKEKELESQSNVIKAKIENNIDKMFVGVEQEDIILLMSEFFGALREKASIVSYDIDQSIEAGDVQNNIFVMDVSFSGEYSEFMTLVNRFWEYNKYISIEEISMSLEVDETTTGDIIAANIKINMYNLHLTGDEKQLLILWILNEMDEMRNPFYEEIYPKNTSDYLYLGEKITGEDIFIFKKFVDIEGHWAEDEINTFSKMNFVYGMHEDMFEPETPITKSQFVVMLDRVLKWPLPTETIDIDDIEGLENLSGFDYEYKKALYKGYLKNIDEDVFESLSPDETLSREQVEKIIQNTIDSEFTWDNFINEILSNGVELVGFADNMKTEVTRAEAVYLLYYFR